MRIVNSAAEFMGKSLVVLFGLYGLAYAILIGTIYFDVGVNP